MTRQSSNHGYNLLKGRALQRFGLYSIQMAQSSVSQEFIALTTFVTRAALTRCTHLRFLSDSLNPGHPRADDLEGLEIFQKNAVGI
jgi:hypothetical protein